MNYPYGKEENKLFQKAQTDPVKHLFNAVIVLLTDLQSARTNTFEP